jgi:hypothetical protein
MVDITKCSTMVMILDIFEEELTDLQCPQGGLLVPPPLVTTAPY